jgi:uncharacterized membrane protein YfcA
VIPSLTPAQWGIATLAAFCIGLTKSGFGGFGLLIVSLMAMILPAKQSTGAVLPLLIAADLMAVRRFRTHADWREIRALLPATLPGLLAGWWLLDVIPGKIFGRVLGGMILAMMALVVWQRLDRRVIRAVMDHPALASFSGFLAGISTMTANAGGAAMTFHLMARRFDKMSFVGTCAWFFFITNVIKVPLSLSLGLISGSSLLLDVCLVPVVGAGFLIGRALLGKIPQGPFDTMLVAMSLGAALKLLLG